LNRTITMKPLMGLGCLVALLALWGCGDQGRMSAQAYQRYVLETINGNLLEDDGLKEVLSITLGDLQGTLEYFARQFFGEHTKTRFRPSFFPFTEPSAEVDVTCPFCQGLGCRICKQTGWIEVLGCGMIDPNVLRAAKLDPTRYQGFAAGFGLDRFAMLKYDINDISLLYNGDVRFLRQFR